ncbi:MAG: translocation/assembly module TamB domain-containing protein [Neisseria sp.]|nr:translocation/assembly module TamB domain-containing protein [Neisseria sp.]
MMTQHNDTLERPSESPTDTGNNPLAPPAKPKPPAKKCWLRGILLGIVSALLLLTGFAAWLVSTESGLRFGLYQLPSWFGVNIASKNLNGTLLKGFNGDEWRIETEGADINISSLVFAWQPQELWQKKLHINRLAAGDIHIVSKDTPPTEAKPTTGLPGSVSLPVEVVIDSIEVGRISSGRQDNVFVNSARANYRYNDSDGHVLNLPSLQTPWSQSAGSLTLALQTPFALNGKIDTTGVLDEIAVENHIRLGGSLQDISLNTDLSGQGISLTADSVLHPFAEKLNDKIDHIQIKGDGINPQAFMNSLPAANLDFDATVVPSFTKGLALEGSIDLVNHTAAPADADGIPVRTLLGDFTINEDGLVNLPGITATLLKKGTVTLAGTVDTDGQQLNLEALLDNITAPDAVQQQLAGSLNGNITVKGSYSDPETAWTFDTGNAVSTGLMQLQTDTALGQQTLLLKKLQILPKNGGEMNAEGSLQLFQNQQLQLAVNSKDFDPSKLNAAFPAGRVNGDINVTGELANNKYSGKMQFGQSVLSGVPLRGNADVAYENEHLTRAVADILLGRNSIKTDGSFGKAGDRLNLDINAPELDKFGFGLSGLITAKGYVAGEMKKIEANLSGQARNLRLSGVAQVNDLDFKLQGSPDYSRPVDIELKGNRIIIPGQTEPTVIDAINLFIKGTGRNHTIRGGSSMALAGEHYKLEIDANGGLSDQNQWKGTVSALDISGAFNLRLQNRLSLEAGAERVAMSTARWAAMGGILNLDNFVWDKKNGITTKGNASNLAISELHNFYTPPVEHNLVLSGDWDLSYSQNARGYLNIRRQSGDIMINPQRKQVLGLGALSLNTRFQNGRIDSVLDGVTAYGNVNGNVAISQQFGNDIQQAPLSGSLRISAPNLESFRNFLPIGQTLRGSLQGNATIGGRIGDPQLNGTLNGDNLYYRNREIGLILDNGSLRSRLQGQRWHIDSLRFIRGGTVTLSGNIGLVGSAPDVDVTAVFDRYNTLDQHNRRLTLSGEAKMLYTEASGVTLTGALRADSGHFGFQKGGMPTLGDDVVVLGEPPKEAAAPTLISLNLTLDLNNAVRFSGEGLDVTLGGRLNLAAQPGQDVQGVGTVNVVKGRYKAYGQDLEISKGSISFVGPLDNPNLNIRAERRLSPVGAGVEVLGNLNNPRITLVANEPMSEKDKLSWLILNRASSGSDGDEAALSAAAGALLAGEINDRIGLVDDFGFTSRRTRNAQTGELNPAEQVLTVGKQLTNELYLGYEYGIESAEQSVKLVYQLTRTVQAIARVGNESWGGELKYTIRFD